MNFLKTFSINMDDGSTILANVVVNFEYMGNKYCIYSVNTESGVDVCCAKNIDGILVKVTDAEEKEFVDTVVGKVVNAVVER